MSKKIGVEGQLALIREFWLWFADQSTHLISSYSTGAVVILSSKMDKQLNKINPKLAWEMGPGKHCSHSLTISAEGDRELRMLVDLMIESAPRLEHWEFYASRQRRPAPAVVKLADRNLEFSTSSWEFSPIERPDQGRIDIIVISDKLALIDREAALRTVFIYLDALLGEDTVEEWIGRIELQAVLGRGQKKYPLSDLKDYLLWATHREKDPLVKVH